MKFAVLIIGASMLSVDYAFAAATPRRIGTPGWPNPPPSER
jgi:hypothetical protein